MHAHTAPRCWRWRKVSVLDHLHTMAAVSAGGGPGSSVLAAPQRRIREVEEEARFEVCAVGVVITRGTAGIAGGGYSLLAHARS